MTTTTSVPVTDSVFDCENCANTIEHVLRAESGVKDVVVDDAERSLDVRFDRSETGEDRISRLVAEWGYTPERNRP
jgi:copper chaperone CopZ